MSNTVIIGGLIRQTDVSDPRTEGLDAPVGSVFIKSGGALPLTLTKFKDGNNFAWGDYVEPQATTAGAEGSLLVRTFNIADAATANYDCVLDAAFEVIDVIAQKRGGAGGAANTVQVLNSTNAISDVLSLNIADTTLARAGVINDAYASFAIGDTLRVAVTKAGGNAACFITVIGVRR